MSNNLIRPFFNGFTGSSQMARIDVIMGAIRQMYEWNSGMENMMRSIIDKMCLYSCIEEFARYVMETIVRERGMLVAMYTTLM